MPYSGLRPTQQSNINAANNRLAEVVNQIAFDAAGQQTRPGGWTLAYDGEGRIQTANPTSGSASSYAYDGEGRRGGATFLTGGDLLQQPGKVVQIGVTVADEQNPEWFRASDALGEERRDSEAKNGKYKAR